MSNRNIINAPDFPTGLDWINLPHGQPGLSLSQLRGKLVLLEFWTFG